jgi:hypothetical protein
VTLPGKRVAVPLVCQWHPHLSPEHAVVPAVLVEPSPLATISIRVQHRTILLLVDEHATDPDQPRTADPALVQAVVVGCSADTLPATWLRDPCQRLLLKFLRPRRPIHSPVKRATGTRTLVELQSGKSITRTTHNSHDCPVGITKDPSKGLFVGTTG